MLIAEAFLEKKFNEDNLNNLANNIVVLMNNSDGVPIKHANGLLTEKFSQIDKICSDIQSLKMLMDRSTSAKIVVINNKKFTLADAIVIKDILELKLSYLKQILNGVWNRNNQVAPVVGLEQLTEFIDNTINDLHILIRTIDKVIWSTEITIET